MVKRYRVVSPTFARENYANIDVLDEKCIFVKASKVRDIFLAHSNAVIVKRTAKQI